MLETVGLLGIAFLVVSLISDWLEDRQYTHPQDLEKIARAATIRAEKQLRREEKKLGLDVPRH